MVGAKIPDTVVFPAMNRLNGDYDNKSYNTKFGVYKPGCGFENLRFAYGHDEYVYRMLKFNKCAIPEEGLAMIRYHSCYPWHSKNEYDHFMSAKDHDLKKWVQEFNQFVCTPSSTSDLMSRRSGLTGRSSLISIVLVSCVGNRSIRVQYSS